MRNFTWILSPNENLPIVSLLTPIVANPHCTIVGSTRLNTKQALLKRSYYFLRLLLHLRYRIYGNVAEFTVF